MTVVKICVCGHSIDQHSAGSCSTCLTVSLIFGGTWECKAFTEKIDMVDLPIICLWEKKK